MFRPGTKLIQQYFAGVQHIYFISGADGANFGERISYGYTPHIFFPAACTHTGDNAAFR
jgi:hypothetical protein